jgi:hypothetical protein
MPSVLQRPACWQMGSLDHADDFSVSEAGYLIPRRPLSFVPSWALPRYGLLCSFDGTILMRLMNLGTNAKNLRTANAPSKYWVDEASTATGSIKRIGRFGYFCALAIGNGKTPFSAI